MIESHITEEMIQYAQRYGGLCRDCADENGICPTTGISCGGRETAVRFTAKAINYGIEHGFIATAAPTPEPIVEGADGEKDAS